MNKLFVTSLCIAFFQTLLFAKVVTTPGALSAGDEITYYPKRGDSFRVTEDLDYIVPNASFDVQLRNGQRIYFDGKNQTDDIYFVFNEPVEKGDEVVVKVNQGMFKYVMQSLHALPKAVKSVLKANKKEKKKKRKKVKEKKEQNSLVETEHYCFDENDNAYPCEEVKQSPIQNHHDIPVVSSVQKFPKQQVVKKNFFQSFSDKIEQALHSIKKSLATNETVKKDKKVSSDGQKIVKPFSQNVQNKIKKLPVKKSKKSLTLPVDSFKTKELENQKVLDIPHLSKPLKPQMSDDLKVDYLHDTLPTYRPDVPKKLERLSSYDDLSTSVKAPVYKPQVQKRYKLSVDEPQMDVSKISTPAIVQKPSFTESKKELPVSKISTPQMQKTKIQIPVAPSFQSQEIKVSQKPNIKPIQVPVSQPEEVITQQQPAQIIKQTTPPPVKQTDVVTQVVEPVKENHKIVITKIIDKKKKKEIAIEPMQERMSDRVLGGGYSDTQSSGKISVKAYSNRKPISAWIEVYQRDNIHRVKTFYTGQEKDIKLPAGTYILKASYRSGSSKQKKVLGRIRLKAGESIHKKVYFNVGTLNVVCKKHKNPAYAKIEVYKKKAKRRYAYTFSSRSTGIAHLKLGEGYYKIIVLEHTKRKVFDNVHIQGSGIKTLSVDF